MRPAFIALLAASSLACSEPAEPAQDTRCDEDNGGLVLQDGFCAQVVIDSLGRARHLTVRDNGDIYVALRQPTDEGGIAALRDSDGDGRADVIEYFGEYGGTGIQIQGDYLYFAPDTLVLRYRLPDDGLAPTEQPDVIVSDFPNDRSHAAKPFEFDEEGGLFVNVGAPSNACQNPGRTPGVAGRDPCPLLDGYAGIWKFEAETLNQTYADDGIRFATGIRHSVAVSWNPFTQNLYVVQHGRDQLSQLWPELYSDSMNAELPAEEFLEVNEGDDFGWPYCYYDQLQGKKVLAPEYGGDGNEIGRCSEFEDPIVAFPGHWAPNDLLFYGGDQFPERYREGAFIAFHGSWNRAPLVQQGYKVVFVPFVDGVPSEVFEVFADRFAGVDRVPVRSDARHRPMGLAVGPDGSLFVTDSMKGKIWRIFYRD